jgi:hypothetical protein
MRARSRNVMFNGIGLHDVMKPVSINGEEGKTLGRGGERENRREGHQKKNQDEKEREIGAKANE